MSEYEYTKILIKYPFESILDVGCDKKILKEYLPKHIKYQGIDFQDAEEVKGCDLEKGIPYPDNSFDVVVSLHTLEHTENIHFLFKELIRVARKEVIIALPNAFH